jgi:hypothetical protein
MVMQALLYGGVMFFPNPHVHDPHTIGQYELTLSVSSWNVAGVSEDEGIELVMTADRGIMASVSSFVEDEKGGRSAEVSWTGALQFTMDELQRAEMDDPISIPMPKRVVRVADVRGIRGALTSAMLEWRGRALLLDDLVQLSIIRPLFVLPGKVEGDLVVLIKFVSLKGRFQYFVTVTFGEESLSAYPFQPLSWRMEPIGQMR